MAFECLRPNGDHSCELIRNTGDYNYANVDEQGQGDYASTYNYSDSSSFYLDLYDFPNPPANMRGTITSVVVFARVRLEVFFDYASGQYKLALKIGDTVYYAAEHSLPSAWELRSSSWNTNPATGNPWQWSEIDDLRAGLALRWVSGIAISEVTQVWMRVVYDLPTGEVLRPVSDSVIELIRSTGNYNYETVDEETPDDGDYNYIWEQTSYKRDLYGMEDHHEGSGTINYVTVVGRVASNVLGVEGYGWSKPYLKVGSTEYPGQEKDHDILTAEYSQTWLTNPATDNPWSWSDIDALISGWGLKGIGNLDLINLTQFYVIVNYTDIIPLSISDGVKLSDTAGRFPVLHLSSADGVSLGDSAGRLVLIPLSTSDGVVWGDNSNCIMTMPCTAVDGVKLADSAIITLSMTLTTGDEVNLSDGSALNLVMILNAADGARFSDAVNGLVAWYCSAVDGALFGDGSNAACTVQVSIADGINLGDIASRIGVILLSSADAIKLGDAAGRIITIPLSVADEIRLSDEVLASFNLLAVVADEIRFSDISQANMEMIVNALDRFVLSDTAISESGYGEPRYTFTMRSIRKGFSKEFTRSFEKTLKRKFTMH